MRKAAQYYVVVVTGGVSLVVVVAGAVSVGGVGSGRACPIPCALGVCELVVGGWVIAGGAF
jgi:hypothetical protein